MPDGTPSRIAGEPDVAKVLQEINGFDLTKTDASNRQAEAALGFRRSQGRRLDGMRLLDLQRRISRAYGHNRARDRKRTGNPLEPEWGFAWPHNRRVMYNRCSADPDGKPWSERKKLIWWDEAQEKWVGPDVPDFPPDKPPDYSSRARREGDGRHRRRRAVHHEAGRHGLALRSRARRRTARFRRTTSRSNRRSRICFYPEQPDNPTTRYFESPLNRLAHQPTPEFPVVGCTFRLTEHYLSGPMSRFNSWLNELQPEMFVELSPELAAERGIEHGGWLVVRSPRGAIEARAMVTRRLRPLRVRGKTVHQIGMPFHWGYAGETVGSVANDLTSLVADPNVSMHEGKVFVCQVGAGRLDGAPSAADRAVRPVADACGRTRDRRESAQPEGHLR